jgi:HPt (histidine-containing phosphotransfer) domain-containing protein
MKADLDACLEAGMNDYVTKPIERRLFVAALRRWLSPRGGQTLSSEAVTPPPPPVDAGATPVQPTGSSLEGIDIDGTIRRLGIDRATLERMLVRFAEGQVATVNALRSAIAEGDVETAARHAHSIAGAAGNLGAGPLRDAAKALELAARDGRTDLSALLHDVEARATTVFRSIGPLATAGATPPVDNGRPYDPGAATAALERLTTALDDSDLSSVQAALSDLDASGLSPATSGDLRQLQEYVDSYDYGEAREVAVRLLHSTRTDRI